MPRLSYASVEDAFLELANASHLRIAVESARRYVSEGIRVREINTSLLLLEHLAGWHHVLWMLTGSSFVLICG